MKITRMDYKKPASFWLGKQVKLLKEIRNARFVFHEGEEMIIDGKWKGFGLYSKQRTADNLVRSISRVSIADVELLEIAALTESEVKHGE